MATWLEQVSKLHCPSGLIDNAPGVCTETKSVAEIEIKEETSKQVTGCRGITCEQCWNQESEEK